MSARVSARDVAFEVLRAVDESDAYSNLALPQAISRAQLTGPDAALATELTYGTLRQRGTWDAVIVIAAARGTDKIDPAVLDILRVGVHQILGMRVPAHAAVNEAVTLTRRVASARAAGFVNAVLRQVAASDAVSWLERAEASARSDDERLAVRFSHPVWVIRALRRALDAEGRAGELVTLLESDNAAPTVTLAALPGLAEIPETAEHTLFSPYGFRSPGGDPAGLVQGSGNAVRVQDEGSQLAALALVGARTPMPGEKWLDLCAGPGGKTALLAAEAHRASVSGTRVALEANELVPARAGLVRRSIAAVPVEIPVSEEDGRMRARRGRYDRILVDAPCTGLGALRRRPEARWRKSPADVGQLVSLQQELLSAAIDGLAPGGVVAYVTCSPHLAETRDVVRDVLADREGVEEMDARAVLREVAQAPIDLPAQQDDSGRAQLWPHRHGTDAMSISLLRRR
ncbi:transcription antitermination factor NusB [Microbacterium sediminicola]|uniref:Transcription antitermination factor NusB n=1 Tax=Microbacterium sediminicola TaxID=415210 RepID=A0ABN2HTX8_9MICO